MTGIEPEILIPPGSISYQELLDTDTHPVAPCLRKQSPRAYDDQERVPVRRYISREYHELEKERLWSRTWQMACREEHLSEVGDTYVYDIADQSYLLVRSSEGEVQAFVNACLHRGRQLRDVGGPTTELRCAFHGFCWNLDGSMKEITCDWDFPHLDKGSSSLPEIQVGTWGGFVFVNPDPEAESLESFLEGLDEHFEKWPLEQRYVEVHVMKELACNWKVAHEAFLESLHVVTTHPQRLVSLGDANSQIDCWDNFARVISANGTPSPHLKWQPTEQQMFDSMVDRRIDDPVQVEVPEGKTTRQVSGELVRTTLGAVLGAAAEELSDAESLDAIIYSVFPNLQPWGAYQRVVYRFRPNGDDHESSVMDVILLSPFLGERPPPAPVTRLGPDDPWMDVPELGSTARIFDQDSYNMPRVQIGLRTTRSETVVFSRSQESGIRHFHHLLERYVGE